MRTKHLLLRIICRICENTREKKAHDVVSAKDGKTILVRMNKRNAENNIPDSMKEFAFAKGDCVRSSRDTEGFSVEILKIIRQLQDGISCCRS